MTSANIQILLSVLEIFCFLLILGVYTRTRKQRKRLRFEREKLTEILATSPCGYFYFLPNGVQICSRRLAVLLGIYENKPSFDILLKKISAESQIALKEAVFQLSSTGKEFVLTVSNASGSLRLNVQGIRASTLEGKVLADVLWFGDETDLLAQNEIYSDELKTYRLRDELFQRALDGLPFAFWLRNQDLSLAYCNKTYVKLAKVKDEAEALKKNVYLPYEGENKMGAKLLAMTAKTSGEEKSEKGSFIVDKKSKLMQIYELPMTFKEKEMERFTVGFTRDIQNEENLKESLDSYLKAQYQVLGALSSGIVIFDANAYVQFFNKAFCELWKLSEEWLVRAPSYAGILEKLREKRLLPEEGNFLKFKHKELEKFSTLSSLQEDIMYLPDGHIYKRTMTPYPLGGVVMTFDDVSDKISLERLYNTQLANQQSILNQFSQALLVFNEEGRLKLWNSAYEHLFNTTSDFLKSEPLLIDVLNSQKNTLCSSDDIWDLLSQKILNALEEDSLLELNLTSGKGVLLKTSRLPDGGLLLRYE